MEIIVEVLARNGRVQERIRIERANASIGRGYDNTIILADPYVCPHHLQLHYDEEHLHWMLRDLSSKNGAFVVGQSVLQQPHVVMSGDEIDLGQTRIRLMLPDHEIAPTKRMPPGRLLVDYFGSPVIASALLVLTVAVFAVDVYLSQGSVIQWQELTLQGLMLLAVPFGWACFWSLIGRVFVHDARFAFHLSVGSMMVLAAHLMNLTIEYFQFTFHAYEVTQWLELMLDGLLSVVVLLSALLVTTNYIRRKRWLVAGGLTFSLLGISLLYSFVNANEYRTQYNAYGLKPPFAMIGKPISSTDFVAGLDKVIQRLDVEEEPKRQEVKPAPPAE